MKMDEKAIFRFLKRFKADKEFSKREIFIREMDDFYNEARITKISEKLSPVNKSGTVEDIIIEHISQPDCGCNREIAAQCCVCGWTCCENCLKRLKSFCSVCGRFVCPEDSYPGISDPDKVYCRFHRFSLRRLIWE
jgi:hypothetical protein